MPALIDAPSYEVAVRESALAEHGLKPSSKKENALPAKMGCQGLVFKIKVETESLQAG